MEDRHSEKIKSTRAMRAECVGVRKFATEVGHGVGRVRRLVARIVTEGPYFGPICPGGGFRIATLSRRRAARIRGENNLNVCNR